MNQRSFILTFTLLLVIDLLVYRSAWGQPPANKLREVQDRELWVPVPAKLRPENNLNLRVELPANELLHNAKVLIVFQIVRGMIQNELNVVSRICSLTDEQKQSLLDLAEREWSSRASASVNKSVQPNVLGSIDLDGLSERLTQSWLKQVATPEQCIPYDSELSDRMEYRKTAVISSALDVLQPKLEMSGRQLRLVEGVLRTEWRDRWYRSFESTFFNPKVIPELRIKWFANILTSAQESALSVQDGQTVFGGMTSPDECPFLPVATRFSITKLRSSDSIKLEFVEVPNTPSVKLDDDDVDVFPAKKSTEEDKVNR